MRQSARSIRTCDLAPGVLSTRILMKCSPEGIPGVEAGAPGARPAGEQAAARGLQPAPVDVEARGRDEGPLARFEGLLERDVASQPADVGHVEAQRRARQQALGARRVAGLEADLDGPAAGGPQHEPRVERALERRAGRVLVAVPVARGHAAADDS
jgi:hypothetical protein